MDDDKTTRHGMFAVIAFNVVIIFCVLLFGWLRGGMSYMHWYDFLLAIVLAVLAAGGTFAAAMSLDL